MREVHLFISGVVQGVGFRAAVKWVAEDCQIKGFVRNLPDGRVEVCAQGEEKQIEEFLKKVQTSGIGRIDRMERENRESSEIYTSFKILRGSAL